MFEEMNVDPAAIEYMFQIEYDNWNSVSSNQITRSVIDPEKKNGFNLYLQTNPARAEARLVKECMIN